VIAILGVKIIMNGTLKTLVDDFKRRYRPENLKQADFYRSLKRSRISYAYLKRSLSVIEGWQTLGLMY